ncbi:hypothetical protein GQ55_8G227300 [Panicum hallii var. hallii]|uniref:Uncharacterized protein n=1 Tax=Panicum hallii var. hallii TaxID=1504633 RepID=A0A2T7CQ84_9POAL|nr:hypothetical protein GQ55_8G227300 [Panicum hallii var. hallii]
MASAAYMPSAGEPSVLRTTGFRPGRPPSASWGGRGLRVDGLGARSIRTAVLSSLHARDLHATGQGTHDLRATILGARSLCTIGSSGLHAAGQGSHGLRAAGPSALCAAGLCPTGGTSERGIGNGERPEGNSRTGTGNFDLVDAEVC